jgi:hypothetical protein
LVERVWFEPRAVVSVGIVRVATHVFYYYIFIIMLDSVGSFHFTAC